MKLAIDGVSKLYKGNVLKCAPMPTLTADDAATFLNQAVGLNSSLNVPRSSTHMSVPAVCRRETDCWLSPSKPNERAAFALGRANVRRNHALLCRV